MTVPRCIFTVTTGRSGSAYLTDLLARLEGVVSTHEPRPNFVHCLRLVQLHPELAREFLLDDKVPAIREAAKGRVYVETSHIFCKGFLEEWLRLPELPVPDLVLLHRDYRKVALSMLSLATTPARTVRGAKWYLSPADDSCYTTLPGWQDLHDYQLCYWYCLEIDARKHLYAQLVRDCGGLAIDCELESLNTAEGFEKLRTELNLPAVGLKGRVLQFLQHNRPVNTKSRKKTDIRLETAELDEMERDVQERISRNESAHDRLDQIRGDVVRLRG